jgi:hypothetical protein
VTPGTLVTVAGREGPYVVLGQASYLDDAGRTVEHHWLRVAQDDGEVWVAPEDVTPCEVVRRPIHLAVADPRDLPESA